MLNRLIAPDLNSRFSSAAEAIATLETLKHKKLPLHPPPSSSPWKYQTTLTGHQGLFASVNAVTINANSQILASTSDDKTIRLWDLATGRARLVLQGHSQTVKAIAIHPNNPDPINDQHFQLLLASGSSDRTIKLWNGQNGQEIATLTGHLQTVNTLAFSPDGQTLASGSADKTIKLWHWQTGNLLATLTGHTLAVNALAYGILGSDGGNDFSANATTPGRSLSLLASASTDRTIRLWDGTTYELLRILRDHIQVVRAIAFHPTGKLLATGGEDKTIRLWDTTSGQRIGILSGHSWSISGLAFSPDGKILISSSWDKTLKLWQLHLDQAKINPKVTGTEIAVLKGHTDSVTCVAISPNGTAIASGSRDQTIRLWQLAAKP
jgi:WD40 repeat protein